MTIAQTAAIDRDIAPTHAGCVNAYDVFLELERGTADEAAKGTARALRGIHRRVTIALVGADRAESMVKSTMVSLQLVLAALRKTSDPDAVGNFLSKRVDTCTQHLEELTEEQGARVEKVPKD